MDLGVGARRPVRRSAGRGTRNRFSGGAPSFPSISGGSFRSPADHREVRVMVDPGLDRLVEGVSLVAVVPDRPYCTTIQRTVFASREVSSSREVSRRR